MSPGTLLAVAASAALVAGVSLVSTLHAGVWTRVSTSARHYFSSYITAADWHQVFHAVCLPGS